MSGLQDDVRRAIRLEGFLPTSSAEAPLVAGFESWEGEVWTRGGEVISALFRKFEKLRRDLGTDHMDPLIACAGAAAAIAVPAGERIRRARLKGAT